MKLAIDQKVFIHALERGAMSALSDEAQGDTSSFSPLIKSVKITVGEELVVESGTNLLSTKWSIKATKENGIDVKEKGSVLVPAKRLFDWAFRQKKAKIVLSLSKLKTPEVVKTSDGDMDYGGDNALLVKKVGNLKLISRDESKTGNKWNVDCYDSTQLNFVDFEKIPQKVINIPIGQLDSSLKNVAFSSLKKDYQHIFDSIVIEKYGGFLYMAASDTHRCSIYKLDKATEVDDSFFLETRSDNGSVILGQKILIPASPLKSVSKMAKSNEISISYDNSKNKVYLDSGDWKIRITTVDSAMFDSFPSVACLISKQYKPLGRIPKNILTNRLISASLVNKDVVLFNFNKGTEDSVIIHAVSESGHAPNVSNAPIKDLTKSVKVVWGVKHIMDVANVVKDEDVSFMIPDDSKSVKVISEEEPNLQYYTMVVNNPKYSQLLK